MNESVIESMKQFLTMDDLHPHVGRPGTGQPLGRAAELVLEVVETHGDLYRQYHGFADPVPVPDDAPVFDRALASSGRSPRQTAMS